MSKRKRIIILIIIGIVVIAGTVGFGKIQEDKRAEEKIAAEKKDLGIPIELLNVSRDNIVEDIAYIGTIKSNKSTTVSPSIGGQIKTIHVEEGSMVKAGDILAKIEDSQFNASYESAEKKLNTLELNYNYLKQEVANFHSTSPLVKKLDTVRSNYEYIKEESQKYEILYNEGAIAKTEYDKIQQEVDTACLQLEELQATVDDAHRKLTHERDMTGSQIGEVKASFNELNIKIEDTSIRAPISGLVKQIHYNVGDLAAMGRPFANIDNNDELIVEVNISESDLNRINLGDKAVLKVKGLSDEITSTVSKIIPLVNPKTRVGAIEIGPIKPGEGMDFVSGNSVEVDIVINEVKDKLVIPKSTIKSLDGESVVYVYEDGKVQERKISTGITVGEKTQVIEGLEEGDKIAINNLSKLYKDAKVYIFKGVEGK